MRRLLLVGLAVATAVALTLLANPPVSAGKVKTTYPTVTQTVSALDLDSYEYTVEFIIPVDADTDYTSARVIFHRRILEGSENVECRCTYLYSSGLEDCLGWGDFPVTVSAKYTNKVAKVTCTITAPTGGSWESTLTVYKDLEDWRFPGIQGDAWCAYCP